MNQRWMVMASALVAGALSGPAMLHSAGLANPPLDCSDLGFIFAGSTVCLPLMLGFQAVTGKHRTLHSASSFFAVVAVFLLAGGVSAAASALSMRQLSPSTFMFLLVGLGLSLGVVAVKAILRARSGHAV